MCACEKDFARRFLPHQITEGVELETHGRIMVTLGFQPRICNCCRGLPEEAHPKAEIYGFTSKIERYYWREIYFQTTQRFAEWVDQQGFRDIQSAQKSNSDVYKKISRDVINEIKELHNRAPKYIYQEKSQEEVIKENNVQIVRVDANYLNHSERKVSISLEGQIYTPETFSALYYNRQGYDTLFVESRPFHVIFAVFMWLLIQDPTDPLVNIIGFGDRIAFDHGEKGKTIWTHLPSDFGTSGYARRRVEAIKKHFAIIPLEKRELLWVFDYWVEPSFDLRQYLWAHDPQDVEQARKIVSLLPISATLAILRYLTNDYWHHYLGWPDLLVYRPDDYFFVEVKSSKDKLREDQKTWIQGNHSELHLPFKLLKIHRKIS